MEYIKGPTLNKILDHRPKINRVRKIMNALLKGIRYMGRHNLLHRDLKPENIIFQKIGKKFCLKIIDFGLSCYIHDQDPSIPKVCGTPGYIAPEIFRISSENFHEILTQKIDVFALGVIFHILLYGEGVFETGESRLENNSKNRPKLRGEEELESLEGSPQAYSLLRKMLAFDPEERITIEDALDHEFFLKKATFGCLDADDEETEVPDEPSIQIKRVNVAFKFKNKLIE